MNGFSLDLPLWSLDLESHSVRCQITTRTSLGSLSDCFVRSTLQDTSWVPLMNHQIWNKMKRIFRSFSENFSVRRIMGNFERILLILKVLHPLWTIVTNGNVSFVVRFSSWLPERRLLDFSFRRERQTAKFSCCYSLLFAFSCAFSLALFTDWESQVLAF